MEVKYIYFDNDLDIAPAHDESFTYKPGDDFIMHWKHSPPPENYPYQNLLVSMYNVRFVREITFAHNLPILHPNPPINKEPVPFPFPHPLNPVATSPTEPWPPEDSNNNILQNTESDITTINSDPQPPKLGEICICEDVPDPTCPIHRKSI